MSTTTTNLNMVLNEGQDKFSIPTLNENLTKIDTAIGEQNKNFSSSMPDKTYYIASVEHGINYKNLEGGSFLLTGFKSYGNYEFQELKRYYENNGIITYVRSKYNGTWSDWIYK